MHRPTAGSPHTVGRRAPVVPTRNQPGSMAHERRRRSARAVFMSASSWPVTIEGRRWATAAWAGAAAATARRTLRQRQHGPVLLERSPDHALHTVRHHARPRRPLLSPLRRGDRRVTAAVLPDMPYGPPGRGGVLPRLWRGSALGVRRPVPAARPRRPGPAPPPHRRCRTAARGGARWPSAASAACWSGSCWAAGATSSVGGAGASGVTGVTGMAMMGAGSAGRARRARAPRRQPPTRARQRGCPGGGGSCQTTGPTVRCYWCPIAPHPVTGDASPYAV